MIANGVNSPINTLTKDMYYSEDREYLDEELECKRRLDYEDDRRRSEHACSVRIVVYIYPDQLNLVKAQMFGYGRRYIIYAVILLYSVSPNLYYL